MLETIALKLDKQSIRPAFVIGSTTYSYGDLAERVACIQALIAKHQEPSSGVIAVVDNADFDTYASVLATLMSGCAYLPINPKAPAERNLSILQQTDVALLLTSGEAEGSDLGLWGTDLRIERTSQSLASSRQPQLVSVPDTNLAYLLFTSGSTGVPKGVPISRRNLATFMKGLLDIIDLQASDRVLQMFDLTFDFSVMSLFAPLMVGACVYPSAAGELRSISIYRLLEEAGITCAPMVPSVLTFLRPYFDDIRLDKLKLSIFCGEPLLAEVTEEWSACAPRMRILNFYGPTEATVFCSHYEWTRTQQKAVNGALSIGRPMPNTVMLIVDETDFIVAPNVQGELCLGGEQLTVGYWRDQDKSAKAFFEMELRGSLTRLYRTGDIAYVDEDGDFMYLGRLDQQVKVQGFRIELAEVEHGARDCAGLDQVVAVTTTNKVGLVEIVLCLGNFQGEISNVEESLRKRLPTYMIPTRIETFTSLPLNNNGKIDRPLLRRLVGNS